MSIEAPALLRLRAIGAALCALALLHGCKFNREDHPQFCRADRDCSRDEICLNSFCVGGDEGGADAATAARDSGANQQGDGGSQTGAVCAEGQPPEPCYDGPAMTRDVGKCRGGERVCVGGVYTQCLGQVQPGEEDCNDDDDDCDGMTDETDDAACSTGMKGECNNGMLVCRGAYRVCEPVTLPGIESCNSKDDDCDDEIDEIEQQDCFPPGASGCTKPDPMGPFMCLGLCHPGKTVCSSGQGQCMDAKTAADEEVCTAGNGTAADDDCDLNVDEGCPCSPGQSRSCYSGPMGTEDRLPCQRGMQQCVGGLWGACEGQVMPGEETCLNPGVDDDCDGMRDDVPMLGGACTDPDMPYGICHEGTYQCQAQSPNVVCVTPAPMQELCDAVDQDCDGDPYNGFDLNSNQYCGSCDNSCSNGQSCCEGTCVSLDDFNHDPANCGSCGNACGAGQYCCWNDCIIDNGSGMPGLPSGGGEIILPGEGVCGCTVDCGDETCCGNRCTDLNRDTYNCGFCGNDCTRGIIAQTCCNGQCSSLCVDPT